MRREREQAINSLVHIESSLHQHRRGRPRVGRRLCCMSLIIRKRVTCIARKSNTGPRRTSATLLARLAEGERGELLRTRPITPISSTRINQRSAGCRIGRGKFAIVVRNECKPFRGVFSENVLSDSHSTIDEAAVGFDGETDCTAAEPPLRGTHRHLILL